MNIIPQMSLFEEKIFENLGDLERLQLVIDTINDVKLICGNYTVINSFVLCADLSLKQGGKKN